jgi:hypothetical protein
MKIGCSAPTSHRPGTTWLTLRNTLVFRLAATEGNTILQAIAPLLWNTAKQYSRQVLGLVTTFTPMLLLMTCSAVHVHKQPSDIGSVSFQGNTPCLLYDEDNMMEGDWKGSNECEKHCIFGR